MLRSRFASNLGVTRCAALEKPRNRESSVNRLSRLAKRTSAFYCNRTFWRSQLKTEEEACYEPQTELMKHQRPRENISRRSDQLEEEFKKSFSTLTEGAPDFILKTGLQEQLKTEQQRLNNRHEIQSELKRKQQITLKMDRENNEISEQIWRAAMSGGRARNAHRKENNVDIHTLADYKHSTFFPFKIHLTSENLKIFSPTHFSTTHPLYKDWNQKWRRFHDSFWMIFLEKKFKCPHLYSFSWIVNSVEVTSSRSKSKSSGSLLRIYRQIFLISIILSIHTVLILTINFFTVIQLPVQFL